MIIMTKSELIYATEDTLHDVGVAMGKTCASRTEHVYMTEDTLQEILDYLNGE